MLYGASGTRISVLPICTRAAAAGSATFRVGMLPLTGSTARPVASS